MPWHIRVRQAHRWLSIAFTLTVVANFAARIRAEPAKWLTYAPLVPLFLLLFSGLFLFVLPFVAKGKPRETERAMIHHP